jgi:hypothetical protein
LGGTILEREDILIIVVVAILIVGFGIGITLYEKQEVKIHLTNANVYHSEMMALNPQIKNAKLKQSAVIANNSKSILINELNELRAADTMFASTTQKEYIDDVIAVNTDNMKIDDLTIAASKATNLNEIMGYASQVNGINQDRTSATDKRDTIMAAHPEEFGFEVVKL